MATTAVGATPRAGSRLKKGALRRPAAPGLALHAQPAWARSSENPLTSAGSPRLLETILGAGLAMESVAVPGVDIPFPELVAIALLGLASFRPPRRDLARYGLLALGAAALLVYLVAVTLVNDLDPTRRAVRIGVLMLFVYAIASERLDVKGILYGLSLTALVNVPLFYAGLVSDEYGGYLTGFLGDKNVAGLFYALLPLLLLTMMQRPIPKLMVLFAGLGLTFLTGSRTSLAALGCAVAWVVLSPYLGRVLRLILIFGMSRLVTWAEEDLASLPIFGDRTGTDWFRAQIQQASAEKVAQAPWYGSGLTTAKVDLEQGTFFFHNSYLGLLVEGGWIFQIAVVGAYALLCLRPFSASHRSPSRVALEAAAVVVLVTSLQLGEVFITVYGAILLGMGLLLTAHEAEESAPLDRRRARTERVVARARRGGPA